MGVANCTASRIPSMEFPDITKARREPACGARKTAPVWGKEKVHSPVNRKKKRLQQMFHLSVCLYVCLGVRLGSFTIKDYSTFPSLKSNNKNIQMVYLSSFRLSVVNPKPKLSQGPIIGSVHNAINQSEFEAISGSPRQRRENASDPVTSGFGLASDWLNRWR